MSKENSERTFVLKLSEDEILKILYQHNPWWLKKPIHETKLKAFKRRDYYKIEKKLDDNKILALIGPRQVGKTTLLYQLINELLTKVSFKNILFLSLDDPYLNATLKNLAKIFEVYATHILKEPLNELKERTYFFLDEIQSVRNWEVLLKRWYDLGYKMKFIVTGSSSSNIIGGASEALVGRIYPQIVFPMKFLEYIRFKQEKISDLLKSNNKNMREGLRKALFNKDPDSFYSVLTEEFNSLLPFKDSILVFLNQYFIKGGYPEIANIDDPITAAQYIGNYLHLTIYKDIIRTKKIRDPVALENLFTILSKGSSQFFNRIKLAKTLDLKKDTLNAYIYSLKTTFLISEVEFYSESRVKRVRKEKKIFVNDVGIRNLSASVLDEQTLTNDTEMGRIVETVVADHTRRLRFNLETIPFPSLYYWREKYEVDFVINPSNVHLPIEVKYREDVRGSELQGLQEFDKKFNPPVLLVITKDQLAKNRKTIYVPTWLYLLVC